SPRCLPRRSTMSPRSAARRSIRSPASSRPSCGPPPSGGSSRNTPAPAALAPPKNTTILTEPLNPRDRPDYFLGRVEQAAGLIDKIGRPNVRIQFDFYHVQIICGDLLTRLEKLLPYIG